MIHGGAKPRRKPLPKLHSPVFSERMLPQYDAVPLDDGARTIIAVQGMTRSVHREIKPEKPSGPDEI